MNTTEKYGFRKPEANDFVSVDDLNHNADTMEKALCELDAEVNRLNHAVVLSVSKTGWSGGSAPYTQTVTVKGVTAEDRPVIGLSVSSGSNADTIRAQSKAWGCVDRAVTGTDKITFYCYRKKPEVDFEVQAKGV